MFVRLLGDTAKSSIACLKATHGPLWLEVMPLTFPIVVRAGDRLIQLRLRRGQTLVNDTDLTALHAKTPLLHLPHSNGFTPKIEEGLWISIDLEGLMNTPIGYRAKPHTQPIDLAKIANTRGAISGSPYTPAPRSP